MQGRSRVVPVVVLAAVMGLAALASAPTQPPGVERLVWHDEFERDGLPDPVRWGYDIGGHGWGNKEPQFYTERRLENARVERGLLVIEAQQET